MAKTTAPENLVIVVGDWVVDEYWFLVKHTSEISTHTGIAHYRLSNEPGEYLSDLCGAGHCVGLLYDLRDPAVCDYSLFGVGAWNAADTDFFRHLIHSRTVADCGSAKPWYRVAPKLCTKAVDGYEIVTAHEDASTIRVIRQYHQDKRGLEQVSRVDWELEHATDYGSKMKSVKLPPAAANVFVVVLDLNKGFMSNEVVDVLRTRYPNAKWFVRSKVAKPAWLKDVKKQLELLVIGPELATRLNPWDRWLTNGTITPHALQTAKDQPGERRLLLSDQREVVAYQPDAGDVCVTGQSRVPAESVTDLGWTTAFFTGLVHNLVANNTVPLTELVDSALKIADKHGKVELPASVRQADRPYRPPDPATQSTWSDADQLWRDAHKDCGIITDADGPRLDVWRGAPYLPNYIACIRAKQEIVSEIGGRLRSFRKSASRPASLSILLQADPGSGKTFFAKTLADSFGFAFHRCDVSQMVRKDELFDLFDAIATLQSEHDHVLVFVDEINALLEGNHVYGSFLAPLEEGTYVRRGRVFSLRPCAWMFAGTDLDNTPDMDQGEKLDDFKSRLNIIKEIDYDSLKRAYGNKLAKQLEQEARLEQVYLGAVMIHREFPDVHYVSREVLESFWAISPADSPARTIRRRAQSLRNVRYGRVTRENCGSDWIQGKATSDGADLVRMSFG